MQFEQLVLVAMLSIDPLTKARRVFILEKHIPNVIEGQSYDELKRIAHSMNSRSNSDICAKYVINKGEDNKYTIVRDDFGKITQIKGIHYIQSDCLIAAMNHYADTERITVTQTI